MNGGVNGMMEESKEKSHVDLLNTKTVTSQDTSQDSEQFEINDIEVNNHEDVTMKPPEDTDTHLADTYNTNSNSSMDCESVKSKQDTSDTCPTKSSQETTDSSFIQSNSKDIVDNSSNSNMSFIDTVDSQMTLDVLKNDDPLRLQKNYNSDSLKDDTEDTIPSKNGETDEEDSEDDGSSEVSGDHRAEQTLSILSESDIDGQDESSKECQSNNESSDVILLENERSESLNGNSKDCTSPEVHEIVSDNEDPLTEEKKEIIKVVKESPVQLRRSSRAIKRKTYDNETDDEKSSDIEETPLHERRRSKAIVINDTKRLVEMAAKSMKPNSQKKESTVVIIDTHSNSSAKGNLIKKRKYNLSFNTQNLYQSFVARGTTVTPVSSKNISNQSSCNSQSQAAILPSLTDNMFVVEAPSFIVPYVYEKPSIEPFREFVDNLGKELKEQRAKEEEKQKEKEKENIECKEMLKKEKGEGEEEKIQESEEEDETEKEKKNNDEVKEEEEMDETKQKKKDERKERRRQKVDDDDASWDGESSTDSDDDIVSDEESNTIVIKEKVEAIEDIKDVTDLTVEKVVTGKSDNYFDLSLGKFFMNIGLHRVQEYVQNDLLKQQNRKLYRERRGGHSTKATESSIASLTKNLEFSKENNAPYTFKQQKCEFCSFKSESLLVLSHHLETPHMKNSVYKCNFCVFESRSPHDILYHMEAEHNTRGRLERAPAYHQCANCPFEDNGKGKLARHFIPCAKKFKPELNLAPPIEWEPPAKIPKIVRPRSTVVNSYQNTFHRGQMSNNMGRPPINSIMAGTSFRPRGRSPMIVGPRSTPIQGISILRGGVTVRHSSSLMSQNYPAGNNGKNSGLHKSLHQPSISITPLPRQPQPQPVQTLPTSQQNNSCVICEICDGYIKDLEQLRNHMQWIHKVKIHPKMIYNRPPLNCQKCQFRFFTDQGLERHLLGSHGLVTSSMQEAANKGKDAGRCPVCGKVYQWKLLSHVGKDHNLILKPAHLSYKCTVCTATFGMYKQFENHVYSAHSVVAKRVMDKGKTPPPVKTGQSLLKPLKINDEITIIPQPAKPNTPLPNKEK